MKKNALIGQSGGPTAAINASLAGVIENAIKAEEIGTVYGAVNGIKGLLREDFINLSEIFGDSENLELLKQTPSSYLGSCRYKLAKDEHEKVIDILKKNNIGYFFYIGGNDSMDTVMQLSQVENHDIKIIGIPKTIDNDLAATDHCPGFGSCAKYISTVISEVAIDSGCYDIKNVTIIEIMGRNAGWLTASAALARVNGGDAPHLIYLPEVPFDTDKFINDIKFHLETTDSVVVAVSEGIKDKYGEYIASASSDKKEDKFGHKQLGGAGKTLENIVKDRLGIKVRSIELNTPQRCAAHIASLTDIEESVLIGKCGVDAALSGKSGKMMTYKRENSENYSITIDSEDITKIANVEKKVPTEFINEDGNNITDEFIKYALPLIQGECNIKFHNGLPKVIRR